MKNYITKYLILLMGMIITSFSVASNNNFTFPTKKQKKPQQNSLSNSSTTLTDETHFDEVDNWLEEDEEIKKEIEKEQKEREESSKQHSKLKNTAEDWFLDDEELLKEYGFSKTPPSLKKNAHSGAVATANSNTKTTQTKEENK